jgi:hypothetical protein
MNTYEIRQERSGPLEAWAVIAIGEDGERRYVAREMTGRQAQTMLERLNAMIAAASSAAKVRRRRPPPGRSSS